MHLLRVALLLTAGLVLSACHAHHHYYHVPPGQAKKFYAPPPGHAKKMHWH